MLSKRILLSGFLIFYISCVSGLSADNPNKMADWMLGGFVRPQGVNPVIVADPASSFFCPMNKAEVKWEESDTFNPAAVVKDGKICVLYRAEDNSATGIGQRVSRVALAETTDGVTMQKRSAPILFPADDNNKQYEWPGGCEDPRVAVTEDGTYVIFYTAWDRSVARLCVATSSDLLTWEKHGPAFAKAYDGKYLNTWGKAASIVTEVKNDKLVISRINGQYFMYWGEYRTHAAVSDNLIDWTPLEDADGKLLVLADTRKGYFDSDLVECGPPAVVTDKGILLLYNGKNKTNDDRDFRFNAGTYSAGQMLFDVNDPCKLLERSEVPFFRPMEEFEKSGQYADGTVFIEGLVYYQNKWFLYYGCADSKVGVAVYDPANRVNGDPIPDYPTPVGISGTPFKGIGKQVVSIHSSSGETKPEEGVFNLLCSHIYPGKKWCENTNEHPWVIFELTDYYNIERIVFRDACTREPANGNIPEYWIYVSTTGTADEDWEEIVHKRDQGEIDVKDDVLAVPVEARYIKFVASRGYRHDNGAKEDAIRMYGFDIYGTFARPVDREGVVSVGKSMLYCSILENYSQGPLNMLDGNKTNPASKWSFSKTDSGSSPEFVIIDLEAEYEIDKFMIYDSKSVESSLTPNISGYKIYLSTEAPDLDKITGKQDDNHIWTRVVNRQGGKGLENIKTEYIEPCVGRYVKLEIPRSNMSDAVSLYQFEVYGKEKDSGVSSHNANFPEILPNVLRSGDNLCVRNCEAGMLTIYDLSGSLWLRDSLKESPAFVPVQLPAGTYIVSLDAEKNKSNSIVTGIIVY